jgi:hypothetical protein
MAKQSWKQPIHPITGSVNDSTLAFEIIIKPTKYKLNMNL